MSEIRFEPTPKQFVAWEILNDAETTELGWGGSAGGGKSWLGCAWLLFSCLAYPGTRWLMGRKELVNLKRTTLVTFFKVCAAYGVEPERQFSYNQQTNVVRFANGSEILLFDLSTSPQDPEYTRLGGLELTGAFIDESNEIAEKAVTIVKTRVGRQYNERYGLKPKLLETFNPNKGHVYLRYYKPWKEGRLPPNRRFIQALVTDNPHADPAYVEQLRSIEDETTRQRLLYGNFDYDDDPTSLISYDAATDLFTMHPAESELKYMTVDVARFGGDMWTVFVWKGLLAYRVEWGSRTSTEDLANEIRTIAAREGVPWSRVLIDEAGVGGGVLDKLKGMKGFVGASAAVPRTKVGRDGKPKAENYANLRSQCFFMLAEAVMAREMGVRIDDATIRDRVTRELQAVKRVNDGTEGKLRIVPKDEMKAELGFSPDFADAMSMRMFFEIAPPKQEGRLRERPVTATEREYAEFRKAGRPSLARSL